MRLIVVGVGRVGLAVLEAAYAQGDDVTIIETDAARIERARRRLRELREQTLGPAGFAEGTKGGFNAVEGDATDERVLRSAGAVEADALVVATPDDPANLMICALAKRLGVGNVVARVTDEDAADLLAEVGATPIRNPSHLTAEHLWHAFEVPGVRAFMMVGEDAEIVTLVLSAHSGLADHAVKDARFPRDALLIAVNRSGRVLVPTADLVLRAGDVLTLVARTHLLDTLVGSVLGKPGRRVAERVRGLFGRG